MVQAENRSLSPNPAIITRRTALSGLLDGVSRSEVRTTLSMKVRGNSESSAKSMGSSSPNTTINGLSRNHLDPIRRPLAGDPTIVVDTSQLESDLSLETSIDADVNKLVYNFANNLEDVSTDEEFSLFGDPLRIMIIIKWMRFYKYYPGLDKSIGKPRRDKLKDHLKLPHGSGQKLGTFMINKFNSFKRKGLVSWDNLHPAVYHPATDIWLQEDWKGEIDTVQGSPQPETESPNINLGIRKRPASQRQEGTEKRQMTTLDNRTPLPTCSESITSTSKAQRPASPSNRDTNSYWNRFGTSTVADSLWLKEMKERDQMRSTNNGISSYAKGGAQKGAATSQQQSSLALRHDEQPSMMPKMINIQSEPTNSNGVTQSAQALGIDERSGDLPSLRSKENVCLRTLNAGMKELEKASAVSESLYRQYEALKDELRTTSQILGRGSGSVSTEYNPERGNMKFVLAKKEEKLRIENQLRENAKTKTGLKGCIKTKKIELKQIQNEIKEILKRSWRSAKVKEKVDALITEFEDVRSYTDSSSVSPIGQAAELTGSELSELGEEDVEAQLDLL